MHLQKDHRKAFIIYFSFILVVMLVVVPLFTSALNALEERTVQSSRETLTYGLQQLEAELNSAYQMGQLLSTDKNMAVINSIPSNVLEPGPGKILAIQALKRTYENLFRMITLIEDVGIVLPNRVIIADSRIHMPMEPFWGTYLYAEGISSLNDWLSYIHASNGTYAFNSLLLKRYEKGAARRLIFSYPMSLTRSEGAYCYAILNEDTLLRSLVQSELLHNSRFTLTWGNRTLIDHAAENTSQSTVRIEAVSSSYRLTARLDIDRTFFTRQLQEFYIVGILFLAGYLLFGVVMALLYSRHSVTPLTQTVKAIREVTQSPDLQEEYKDSYAYINHFIEQADKLLKENKLALASQEMFLKENLMERILRGLLFHTSPSALISQNFPDFPMPCVMCMAQFAGCSSLTPQQFASLQVKARRIAEESVHGRVVLHFSADLLVIMRDVGAGTAEADQALCERFGNETNFDVRMCISQPIHTPDALSPTFARMRQLMRVTDASQTLLYEDKQAVLQPYQSLQYTTRFFESLMRSQLEAALALLDEECAAFQCNRPFTEMDVQQFFYCYRHVLCQVMTASGLTPDEIALPKYDPNASLNDLLCGIRTCAATICAAQINRRSVQMDQREKEILRAINTKLGSPDLNIEVIMEMFGISNRALQSLMRQATGTTFMDYVNTQRMERAKHLLCNSDMPIQDVCTACGYASVNTFYKAFQRTFSLTPKAMRDGGTEIEE